MEPVVLAGMIFSLLVVLLIGGFITLFPITRRLGLFLESKYQKDKTVAGPSSAELKQLWDALHSLEAELNRLAERQEFTEQLVTGKTPASLPREQDKREPR